jgi:Fe2+ or Zn2+ uptake regulation protein
MVKYTRAASTKMHARILEQYRLHTDFPPTFREIADALSTTSKPVLVNTVRHHVNVLLASGQLVRIGPPHASRNIRLAPEQSS